LSVELRDAIEQAILDLPRTLRAAVVIRDIEGLSTAEAAASLGIGESAMKVRLHRARHALQNVLLPYLEDQASHLMEQPHAQDR
jgi:RNA polymerase sigma-70 factor (ECF subfamily)